MAKAKYVRCMSYHYQNGTFEGGIVVESTHDQNEYYLAFFHDTEPDQTWVHEFALDEAAVIISCLSNAIAARENDFHKKYADAWSITVNDDGEYEMSESHDD